VESVAANSILFFLTWVIILLACTIFGVLLQKKRRNLQAFLLTYIPVFMLIGFCFYFSQFDGGPSDFKLVLSGVKDFNYSLTMFTLAVCLIFGFHSFFNYRHYKKEAYFGENKDTCMFMKKLYFWSSIILTLGIIILLLYLTYEWVNVFTCYAGSPPPTPLKPKSIMMMSLLPMKRKQLLEKLYANSRIDKNVYNKIKRNF
jgi:formate hydrogenlyase subunit 3/multisubunit Na+/H+ antiporter MnhD subunit